MPHDIVDNRDHLLVDQIRKILGSTDAARFAVGYFFLSGFTALADKLEHVTNLKLLIGNTTNRETLEQIAEGYKRLELVAEAAEAQVYPKRTDVKRMATETAANIRSAVEVMDQTDEAERIVKTLARMIEEKRLFVKVYTKGRLHAKAYIFDYGRATIFSATCKRNWKRASPLSARQTSRFPASATTPNSTWSSTATTTTPNSFAGSMSCGTSPRISTKR